MAGQVQQRMPVFPLDSVLFPGCRLPLQLFEQRYLAMLSACLKQARGFVIALIRKGRPVGGTPEIFSVGTLAQVIDWRQQENGLLGITVEGVQRVALHDLEVQKDGLLTAMVHHLNEPATEPSGPTEPLIELLEALAEHPLIKQWGVNVNDKDTNSLIWCLAGLLPFTNLEKQSMLELEGMDARRTALEKLLQSLS